MNIYPMPNARQAVSQHKYDSVNEKHIQKRLFARKIMVFFFFFFFPSIIHNAAYAGVCEKQTILDSVPLVQTEKLAFSCSSA